MGQTLAHVPLVSIELFIIFTFCLLSIIVENAGEVASDAEDEHGVDGNGHPYVVGNVVLAIIPVPWASLVDVIAETANIFCQVLSGDINDHVDKEKDKRGQVGKEERVSDSMAITFDKGQEEHDQDNAGEGNSNEVYCIDRAYEGQGLECCDDNHSTYERAPTAASVGTVFLAGSVYAHFNFINVIYLKYLKY